MWAVSKLWAGGSYDFSFQNYIAGAFVAVGLLLDLISIKGFVAARTTINPIHIEKASTLVTDGLYRFTRNPMYLGLALLLTGWAIWLGNPINVAALSLFVLAMNELQIEPEETFLKKKFGQAYLDYQRRVRRWI
jgi:protein-S-isoprenylcysteine O-methyltransferase Ste14